MGRIRTIKPEFPLSEKVGRLSRDARLLFIQIWTLVDDEGRTRAASRMLASLLYPYDDDAVSLIDGWLDELERTNCIRRYEVDGTTYLDIPKWLEHQKIDHPKPSRLPEFREGSTVPRETSRSLAPDLGPRTLDPGPRTQDLGPARASPSGVVTEGSVMRREASTTALDGYEIAREASTTEPDLSAVSAEKPDLTEADRLWAALAVHITEAYAEAGSQVCIDTHRVQYWRSLDYDPKLILAIIRTRLAAKPTISSLNYFDKEIHETTVEIARKRGELPTPEAKKKANTIDWRRRVENFKLSNMWLHTYGPAPGYAGCQVPQELLEEFDLVHRPRVGTLKIDDKKSASK